MGSGAAVPPAVGSARTMIVRADTCTGNDPVLCTTSRVSTPAPPGTSASAASAAATNMPERPDDVLAEAVPGSPDTAIDTPPDVKAAVVAASSRNAALVETAPRPSTAPADSTSRRRANRCTAVQGSKAGTGTRTPGTGVLADSVNRTGS